MSDFYPVLIGIAREERVEEGVRVGVGRVGGGAGWGGRGGWEGEAGLGCRPSDSRICAVVFIVNYVSEHGA